MTREQGQGTLVFFSYSHRDKVLRDKLEEHLSILKYRGLISTWHDREIQAGQEWSQQIDIHLNNAHIILLLISASFMASGYCYGIEMKRALERYEQKDADVVPILLRPVLYTGAPFEKLQMLPTNGRPVVKWRLTDDAFCDIARGIEKIARKYSGYSEKGVEFYETQPYQHRITHELPDSQYSPRLSNEPASAFLSYSSRDQGIAERLGQDLNRRSIRTWRDKSEIKVGNHWQDEILSAIRQSFVVLYLASPDARTSRVVRGELQTAAMYNKPILSIWIAGEEWADVAPRGNIHKQYIDIRGEEQYQQGLEELVARLLALPDHVQPMPSPMLQPPVRQMPQPPSPPSPMPQPPVRQMPLRARRRLSRSVVGLVLIPVVALVVLSSIVVFYSSYGSSPAPTPTPTPFPSPTPTPHILSPLVISGILILLFLVIGIAAAFIVMRFIRAKIKHRLQYYEEAVEVYQSALLHHPRDGYAFQGMGKVLSVLGRYDRAVDAFRQAIEYLPASDKTAVSAAYAGLGDTLARLKRNDEAVAAYEQAMVLDSTVTFNHNDLIRALLALGRKEEAARIRERARQPDHADI